MAFEGKQRPAPEIKLVWRCRCGAKNFVHRASCSMCGEHRPPPVAPKK